MAAAPAWTSRPTCAPRYAGTPIEPELRDLVAQTLRRLTETGAVDVG